jgi:hypothetical protein
MAHAPVDEQRSRRFKSADPGAAAEVATVLAGAMVAVTDGAAVVITEGADVATEQVADISATATNVAVTDISAAVGRSNIG